MVFVTIAAKHFNAVSFATEVNVINALWTMSRKSDLPLRQKQI